MSSVGRTTTTSELSLLQLARVSECLYRAPSLTSIYSAGLSRPSRLSLSPFGKRSSATTLARSLRPRESLLCRLMKTLPLLRNDSTKQRTHAAARAMKGECEGLRRGKVA